MFDVVQVRDSILSTILQNMFWYYFQMKKTKEVTSHHLNTINFNKQFLYN